MTTDDHLFVRYLHNALAASKTSLVSVRHRLDDETSQRILHLLGYALSIPALWPPTRDLMLAAAPFLAKGAYRDLWTQALHTAYDVSRALHDDVATIALALELGDLHYVLGRVEEATQWSARAAPALEGDHPVLHARALLLQAKLAGLQGRHAYASDLAGQALTLVGPDDDLRGTALLLQAHSAFEQLQLDGAAALYAGALDIWNRLDQRRGAALCTLNLGRIAHLQGALDEAHHLYTTSLALMEELGDVQNRASLLMNLGVVHYERGEWDPALALLRRAEESFRTLDDRHHLAMLYNNIGLIYYRQRAWEPALHTLGESTRLWAALGDVKARLNVEETVCAVYLETGRAAEALTTYTRLMRELQATEQDDQFLELEALLGAGMARAAAACGHE